MFEIHPIMRKDLCLSVQFHWEVNCFLELRNIQNSPNGQESLDYLISLGISSNYPVTTVSIVIMVTMVTMVIMVTMVTKVTMVATVTKVVPD